MFYPMLHLFYLMSFGNIVRTEAHSESSQTSKMDLLEKKNYG